MATDIIWTDMEILLHNFAVAILRAGKPESEHLGEDELAVAIKKLAEGMYHRKR